ncbi:hypothetical protein [Prochlorococcus sp. MIT 1318]
MYLLLGTTMLAVVFVAATGFGIREEAISVVLKTDVNPEELLSWLMEV